MEDASYKVVIFGDKGVGKQTFAEKYGKKLYNSETKMTIGVDFYLRNFEINGKRVMLQLWDLGGEERFRRSYILPMYVRGANGAIFMYDVSNHNSLAHIDDWLLVVRKEIKTEQDLFPIIMIGNKADLDEREVTGDEGMEIAKSRGLDGFIECSVKTGENIQEAIDSLTRLMMQKARLL